MRVQTLLYVFVPLGILVDQGQWLRADVKPHPLISENMVLQQGMPVPIWGSADEGETVTVSFQGQKLSATTHNGHWRVDLANLKSGGPYEMTIAGKNQIQLKNVLVGEVWVCSGQSNMEWPVSATQDAQRAIAISRNPMIRLLTVPKNACAVPQEHVNTHWVECAPETVPAFTAVGYFFGLDLQRSLHVPIGLIHSSWGGTPAESWVSEPTLESEPALKYMVEKQAHELAAYPKEIEKYRDRLKGYEESVEKALSAKQDIPALPGPPNNPAKNAWGASTLYNGMIASILPYAIRGATWYQGESNAGRAYEYRSLLLALIKDWRKAWNNPDLTFLIVQLAPFQKIEPEPQESAWAELREAQLLATTALPKVGLAVITDVGETNDIHPRRKQPVGARLALAARGLAYGENIEYSGPVYSEMNVEGNRVLLSFTHVDGGLTTRGGPLSGFTVAGKDRKFSNAIAQVQGNKVVVWSSKVEHPVAVRYGWANYPVVNLWNMAGLPATPFRTDDFPMVTNPHRQ
jgi:sialate O-acetylesterase